MRTLEEVQTEYAQNCAKIGDLEVRKQRAMEQIDLQLEPLHNKCNDLEKEANQIAEVKKEIEARAARDAAQKNVDSSTVND